MILVGTRIVTNVLMLSNVVRYGIELLLGQATEWDSQDGERERQKTSKKKEQIK